MTSYPLILENFSVTLFDRTLFNIDSFIPEPGTSTAITGTATPSVSGAMSTSYSILNCRVPNHGFEKWMVWLAVALSPSTVRIPGPRTFADAPLALGNRSTMLSSGRSTAVRRKSTRTRNWFSRARTCVTAWYSPRGGRWRDRWRRTSTKSRNRIPCFCSGSDKRTYVVRG